MTKQPSAVFIMGPTASGKTDLAIELVKRYPFEIISVDSALVYKEMNIGTAKPSKEELAVAPHRLIDFLDPAQTYSTATFRDDALEAMEDIHLRHKIPLLVGGTMLYHRSLLYGLSELPEADEAIRTKLQAEADLNGAEFMHQKLAEIDPAAAKKIHPNDPQRIQRALEVYEISGKTMTQLQLENQAKVLPWNVYKIIVAPRSRDLLRERIAIRFKQMIEQGLIEEVEGLFKRGDLDLSLPSMRAVGYRQVWEYLEGKMNKEQMIDRSITITRQFAKRQMTWLRREKDAAWIATEADDIFEQAVNYLQPVLNEI
ncbi:MAG: tRNA (adenosine(37)-N6)-dimethylallyltransferase MiaA [gamma proteobacterium symbiont of Bathyaustriella thionipta]|nr:tRNA (adenosine(37)-N6)-dimethylallyltransferase MiaA [gamma proteobacterium symbiont of Bathyaustriella thionipta]MCU7948796.1 tRNA (adenosine(37)-N6)-dimethylallyltransferase MiaA [gamma proteobacterium symbiont of Bathyaustriella thionipta]MCU7954208.1 tRNA (adenosine(37)-N6)-dimethylallyltransferase MiaA [gamma proteobacterium symbiont of Bathyaustriella thionipta]MCU7955254.1 tRNA (adenosine(37)-N6)-dimethylallyltransferase MiaA [gamma proteobacterium symbiont of Bathyaustriella thionipt